jgi:hypothetical protein
VAGSPNVLLTAHGVGNGGVGDIATDIGVHYSYEVLGPTNGVVVPLSFTWAASITSIQPFSSLGPLGGVTVAVSGITPDFGVGALVLDRSAPSCPSPCVVIRSETDSFLQRTGVVGTVDLGISLDVAIPGDDLTVMLDPMITIDPIFLLDNPGYSLIVSPGIGNGPTNPVPEPESYAMLLAGLGLLGFLARRRKLKI